MNYTHKNTARQSRHRNGARTFLPVATHPSITAPEPAKSALPCRTAAERNVGTPWWRGKSSVRRSSLFSLLPPVHFLLFLLLALALSPPAHAQPSSTARDDFW